MKRTLQQQIQANRRGSVIMVWLLILILAGLGTAIAGTYAPRQWYIGTAGATLLGGIMAIVARSAGPGIVLGLAHAREATHFEDQMLSNVVEEMAIASGLPKPKIYVIDDDAPNAFATGKDPQSGVIAITTGLLRKLDRDELQGVVAHEMAHIRNYDIRFMTTVALIAGLIPLLADAFLRMQWFGGGRRGSDDDREGNQLAAVFQIVGLVLAILAPIFAALLEMAVSRKREYLADATAAEMTRYPEGLARALKKIAMDPDPLEVANRATQHMYIVNPLKLSGDGSDLLSTHPPTEARIRALMGLAGNRNGMLSGNMDSM
ncbi:MAG: M48 family metallopeptidase [Fimbriimonas sp.]